MGLDFPIYTAVMVSEAARARARARVCVCVCVCVCEFCSGILTLVSFTEHVLSDKNLGHGHVHMRYQHPAAYL